MFYGIMVGDNSVLLTDESHGKPVIELAAPDSVPVNWHISQTYYDNGDCIVCSHEIVPDAGSASDAAIALTRLQFMSLPDTMSYEYRALAPYWENGVTYYGPDDPSGNYQSKVQWKGYLYKCLQTHAAQADWAPDVAPSLWAMILPGQSGSDVSLGEWVQPDSTNGYSKGDQVIHNGHLWESTYDGSNVWEPGTVGAPWTDLGIYESGPKSQTASDYGNGVVSSESTVESTPM